MLYHEHTLHRKLFYSLKRSTLIGLYRDTQHEIRWGKMRGHLKNMKSRNVKSAWLRKPCKSIETREKLSKFAKLQNIKQQTRCRNLAKKAKNQGEPKKHGETTENPWKRRNINKHGKRQDNECLGKRKETPKSQIWFAPPFYSCISANTRASFWRICLILVVLSASFFESMNLVKDSKLKISSELPHKVNIISLLSALYDI